MYPFAADFERLGIFPGDTVLMHSSMKSLQTTETPETFLAALSDYLGERGTLLLPTLSYESARISPIFSVRETPACIGLLPNVFRQLDGVVRSLHPTHSCAAKGYLAKELTYRHIQDETPVGPNSPFRLLPEVGGKILMLGPVNDHNTFMHGMEEIAEAPYCLCPTRTHYTVIGYNGERIEKDNFAHNFATIARQCYARAESLLQAPDVLYGNVCKAPCALLRTAALQPVAVAKMKEDPYFFVDRKPNTEELIDILNAFVASGWDLIAIPAKKWLSRKWVDAAPERKALIEAIQQAERECGSCGCELDPLYKRALELL